jgi:7-cyano-7-deazaguanine synthase
MGQTAIVLLSGGIDSATCLAIAAQEFERVVPVHYDYGQQTADLEHRMAIEQRDHIADIYEDTEVEDVRVVEYAPVFTHFAQGVAGDRDSFVTESGELEEDDGRSTGYVPMRNLHLIGTGAAIADVESADAVFHGAQGGDEESYPDCRPEFMDAIAGAVNKSLADDDHVDVRVPLLHFSKEDVILAGTAHRVDWHYTYSCYEEVDDIRSPEPCGECPACVEREEAFEAAGVEDPHSQ